MNRRNVLKAIVAMPAAIGAFLAKKPPIVGRRFENTTLVTDRDVIDCEFHNAAIVANPSDGIRVSGNRFYTTYPHGGWRASKTYA